MKLKNLQGVFRTKQDIGDILGKSKQGVHNNVEFKRLKDARLMEPAIKRRYKAITADYKAVLKSISDIKENEKSKVTSK